MQAADNDQSENNTDSHSDVVSQSSCGHDDGGVIEQSEASNSASANDPDDVDASSSTGKHDTEPQLVEEVKGVGDVDESAEVEDSHNEGEEEEGEDSNDTNNASSEEDFVHIYEEENSEDIEDDKEEITEHTEDNEKTKNVSSSMDNYDSGEKMDTMSSVEQKPPPQSFPMASFDSNEATPASESRLFKNELETPQATNEITGKEFMEYNEMEATTLPPLTVSEDAIQRPSVYNKRSDVEPPKQEVQKATRIKEVPPGYNHGKREIARVCLFATAAASLTSCKGIAVLSSTGAILVLRDTKIMSIRNIMWGSISLISFFLSLLAWAFEDDAPKPDDESTEDGVKEAVVDNRHPLFLAFVGNLGIIQKLWGVLLSIFLISAYVTKIKQDLQDNKTKQE